jgi:cell division protein ZapA
MAQINVTIAGRVYRMACDDGQEEHLTRLGAELDQRIEVLKGQFGEIGDMRAVVMAAIMVADEMSELQKRLRRVEEEVAALRDARFVATERNEQTQAAVARALTAAAERVERATQLLNQSISPPVGMG